MSPSKQISTLLCGYRGVVFRITLIRHALGSPDIRNESSTQPHERKRPEQSDIPALLCTKCCFLILDEQTLQKDMEKPPPHLSSCPHFTFTIFASSGGLDLSSCNPVGESSDYETMVSAKLLFLYLSLFLVYL